MDSCNWRIIADGFRKYDCGGTSFDMRSFSKNADGEWNIISSAMSLGVESVIAIGSLKEGETVSEDEKCWYDDYSQKYEFRQLIQLSFHPIQLSFECLEYLDE